MKRSVISIFLILAMIPSAYPQALAQEAAAAATTPGLDPDVKKLRDRQAAIVDELKTRRADIEKRYPEYAFKNRKVIERLVESEKKAETALQHFDKGEVQKAFDA